MSVYVIRNCSFTQCLYDKFANMILWDWSLECTKDNEKAARFNRVNTIMPTFDFLFKADSLDYLLSKVIKAGDAESPQLYESYLMFCISIKN